MTENRDGIDRLREAIDDVACELEANRPPARRPRPLLPWAVAAAATILALTAWLTWLRPTTPPEVEVLVLKVRGRPMQARMLEGQAPSTIIIIPRNGITTAPAAASVIAGGVP